MTPVSLLCGRGEKVCPWKGGLKWGTHSPPTHTDPSTFLCLPQEPGTNAEIKEFAAGYNVKFDMYSKICVNGDDAHPLWKWMKAQPKGRGILGK